ncbi:MAG TPA: hypothetical protein VK808_07740 [Bacteroidia bacterium]|nr:hypothetical protein [Bacteroidia bacterium]
MKRYCNLFFLLFSLLFFGRSAKGISFIDPNHCNYFCVEGNNGNSFVCASQKNNNPGSDYVVILFKKGIEGKDKLFNFKSNITCTGTDNHFKDKALSNSGWVKYILYFSRIQIFPQEFICSFSFRGPPELC